MGNTTRRRVLQSIVAAPAVAGLVRVLGASFGPYFPGLRGDGGGTT